MDTFSIGGVIGRTRRIFGLHAIGFSLFAIVVAAVPSWLAQVFAAPRLTTLEASAPTGGGETALTYAAIVALSAAPALVTYLGNLVLAGMVATAAWREVEGRPADFGASLRAGLGLFLPLLLVSLMSGLGILLGSILLVIPGLIVSFMWFVAAQVYVVERRGFRFAFGRSRHLTAGRRWRLVGLTLIYVVASGAASGVVFGALSTLARDGGATATATIVLQVLAAAISGLFSVVSAAGHAATYIELRRAKEGYLSGDLIDAFA